MSDKDIVEEARDLFRIKPLAWEFKEEYALRKYEAGCAIGGVYRVLEWRQRYMDHLPWSGNWNCITPEQTGGISIPCASPEEGKQLAEKHWRAFIEQALIPAEESK